jgi:hypothetical protein
MTTQLTDLMHRATENLEPVTPDLLERSLAQGVRQRRRRTALLTASGAGAVLATAGLIAGGIHALGAPSDTAVAGNPAPFVKPSPGTTPVTKPAGVNPQQTLATLKGLVSKPGRTLSAPQTWGDGTFAGAAYVVNDGHGASRVEVMVSGGGEANPCAPARQGCTTLPDGSVVYASAAEPTYTDGRQEQYGVVSNHVTLYRSDGRNINLASYNAPAEKGTRHTRPQPLLSVADLTKLAQSNAWKLPPVRAFK